MKHFLIVFLCTPTLFFLSCTILAQSGASQPGHEQEIVERFWQVLVKSPRYGTAFDRVYAHYSDAGELETLIEKTRNLTLETPNKGENHLLLGMFLAIQDDQDGAIVCYRKAEELLPDDPTASTYLADLLIMQGRLQEASDALERALAKNNRKNEAVALLQKLGGMYERLGQQEKAEQTWQKMEQLFPDDMNVLARIAGTLEREGKYPQALEMYGKLVALAQKSKDDNARIRFGLTAADIKIRLGNKQEAIDDFERMLDGLNTKSWASDNIRNRIERIFVRNGDYLGLARYYRHRLERRADDLETTRRYAIVLVRLSRYAEAEQLLQNAVEKSPSDIPLKLLLVELFSLQGRFSEAVTVFEQINRIAPNNIDYLTQWGVAVLNNRAIPEDARRGMTTNIWSQIAAIDPNDAVMTLAVARLFTDHGFDAQAEAFFRKAIALRPDDVAMIEPLGHFYYQKNSRDKAVETFRQMVAGSRRNVDALLQLAAIFEKLDLTEETVRTLSEAVAIAPQRFDLRIRLAEACFELPDLDAVQTQLTAAEHLVQTASSPLSDDELKRYAQTETRWLLETNRLTTAAKGLTESLTTDNASPQTRAKRYWKLAVYRSTLGETDAAIRAIDAALECDADSLLILQTAADIARKSQASDNAAVLLWRLVALDKPRRIEHLQSLAILYRDLGEIDKAVDAAEKILQTGTKNPAHYRTQAELFFSIDRNDRAINALRLAIRADPNDQATLAMLADVLFESGRTDEALEPAWRIFDRAETLEMKMAAVDRLVVYYRQMGRFDQLIVRLRDSTDLMEATSNIARKDIAYCTARAYSGLLDYDSARKTLESLLLSRDSDADGDVVLLEHLSSIAEIQGDPEAAIRFREMLLEMLREGHENDAAFERLLALYYEKGDDAKATALLKRKVLAKKELRTQLDMVDALLAREEYTAADEILAALTIVHGDHWELLARQMLLQNWTHSSNVSETARRLLAVKLPPETLAENRLPSNQTTSTNATTAALTAPWRLGDLPVDITLHVDLDRPESLRQYAVHLAGVVFREHIVPERRYAGRTGIAKPEPMLNSLRDAKLSAEIVLLKTAISADQDESNAALLEQMTDRRQTVLRDSDNVTALKSQYRVEKLLELFGAKGPLAKYYPNFAESLAANAPAVAFDDQIAVKLAMQGEIDWENEGLLRLLKSFAADNTEIPNRVETWKWLIATLDKKLKTGDFAASREVWEQTVLNIALLNQLNDPAAGKEISTIIAEAANRSYIVRLLLAEQAPDFDTFEKTVRQALTQSDQMATENRSRDTRHVAFSRAFEKYLTLQRERLFAAASSEFAQQLDGTVEHWRATLDRVQYGQKTLRAFFSNVRRPPELATTTQQTVVSTELLQACNQYESCMYRVLDLWLSLDAALCPMEENETIAKSQPRIVAGNVWFTMVDLRRQIKRDKPVNLSIVSYLVNRSAFGAATSMPRSHVALDMAASMATIDQCFPETGREDRLSQFETYLHNREIPASASERNDFARVGEMIVAAQNINQPRQNDEEIESPELLRHKAGQRLAEIADHTKSDAVPVLIALVLIELAQNNTENAIAILETIPCRRPDEMKARELIVLELTLKSEDVKLASRRESAIEKLSGYQLSEDELVAFWTMLNEIDRMETANVMLNRLVTIATNPRNRQLVLDVMQIQAEQDPQTKERLVAFALKIFRSAPQRSTSALTNEATEQARFAAIKTLGWAGKLEEIADQIAMQVENAPGAITLLMQLGELKLQAGQLEDARQVTRQIADNMPNDPETMLDYAKFLARLEMQSEAEQWTEKAFLTKPELFFASLNSPDENLGNREALALLAKFDSGTIVRNAYSVFSLLSQARRDPATKQEAQKLFDQFWNDTSFSSQESASLRQTAVRSLSFNPDVAFYQYYRQWILDMVTTVQVFGEKNPLFQVTYWSDHQPETFASTFFQQAQVNGKLEEFLAAIQKKGMTYQQQTVREAACFCNAKILEAAAFFALGRTAEGVECLKVIENRCDNLLTEAALTLGLCAEMSDALDADLVIQYYEKAFQADPHQVYEPFYSSRFCVLALKSNLPQRQEFGLQQTTDNLREILSGFEKIGENSYVRLKIGHFSQEDLILFTELYTDSLLNANQRPTVQKAFEEFVIGKPWLHAWENDKKRVDLAQRIQRLLTRLFESAE